MDVDHPLGPQQWLPRHTPFAHWLFEEHTAPIDFLHLPTSLSSRRAASPLILMYPFAHFEQSPFESQARHPVLLPFEPQQ